MRRLKLYYWLHLIHAMMILLFLLTGAILYFDALRTLFSDYKWEIRQFHYVLGFIYVLYIFAILPIVTSYAKTHRRWQKTFHICLQLFFAAGWAVSGVYLWLNNPAFLGIRQFSILVHDSLSLLIVPWIAGHILYYFLHRKAAIRTILATSPDQGRLVTRRDVLILFAGASMALLFGGLIRWLQPISSAFTNQLTEVKRRGYFRIYSVRTDNPSFDPRTWKLTITGLVDKPQEFSFEELTKLPTNTYVHDFHCVTGWSVLGVKWEGIPFHELVQKIGQKPEGIYVKMYSADQIYSETYELSQLMEKNVMLVYRLDDKPLLPSQGAPLRLFHPDMFGYKSIKWVNKIEFANDRGLGYWEEKEGYKLNGYIS